MCHCEERSDEIRRHCEERSDAILRVIAMGLQRYKNRHCEERSDEIRCHCEERSDEIRRHCEERSGKIRCHCEERSDAAIYFKLFLQKVFMLRICTTVVFDDGAPVV